MTLISPALAPAGPFFADELRSHGPAPAIVTPAGVLSYQELADRVDDAVASLGGERRLVLVETANTVETVVAYLAALRGRHPVLLASSGDRGAVDALVERYQPDVIATSGGELIERPTPGRGGFHTDLAVLLSTSGSTGTPKVVRLSSGNLDANAAAIAQYLALGSSDRAITTLPMQYCYGLSVINSHLHAGASIVLTELSVVDQCFWDLLASTGATSFAGVPHTFELLDRVGFEAMNVPSLRYLTQAGGKMPPETVRRYAQLGARRGWELYVMYGQTEATARMAYLPPALADTNPSAVGVPIPGGAFEIDTPDDSGVGELVYRGPNVMLGYADGPDDLALGRVVEELRTRDLARRTTDGLYEIVGRRSRLIKPFGVRIDLDDLERLLATAGAVAMCTGDDHQLIVAIEASDTREVAAIVAERLHLPASRVRVLPFAELPRLATGKADYVAIRADAARVGDRDDRIAADPADAVVAAFTEILGVESSAEDSFVTLGGDSLSYVEMSVRLEELIGSLPRDWHTLPIRELSPAAAPRHRRWAPIDTTVAVRAVAIVLIVGTHTRLWQLPGGAHAILAVAGYNFARFQVGTTTMWAGVARIALPSMLWIGVVAAVQDGFAWPHALLLNGILGRSDGRWAYWFIEALIQMLVPLAIVFAVPAIARLERRFPFVVAAAAVAAGLVIRFDVIDLAVDHRIYRPHEVFWLFALGWAAARATAWHQRMLVTVVSGVALAGFFGDAQRELIVAGAFALVVWIPAIIVPRLVIRPIAAVASASLYIYLTHFQVYPPINRTLGPVAAVAVSVLVGVAAWEIARRVTAGVEHTARRLRRRRAKAAGATPRKPSSLPPESARS